MNILEVLTQKNSQYFLVKQTCFFSLANVMKISYANDKSFEIVNLIISPSLQNISLKFSSDIRHTYNIFYYFYYSINGSMQFEFSFMIDQTVIKFY